MKNMNFYFEDFTLENYKRLLNLAQKKYSFIKYPMCKNDGKQILLRHDVDYSINGALALAKVEHELGISSTYFIYPNSEGYNILEVQTVKTIREIIALGHEIGLHWDSGAYKELYPDISDVEAKLKKDIFSLEELFQCTIDVISFHQPEANGILDVSQEFFAEKINVYSDYFKKNYKYCSDSNGYWRFDRLEQLLTESKYEKMQILLHPIWWQQEVLSPAERVWRYYLEQAKKKYICYCEDMKACGRENIGEEKIDLE